MNTPQSPASAGYRLGELRVRPDTGQITGPNGEVRLEPRVMAVLDMLASQPGQLVSRADLLGSIWPGGDVYDEALTQCVYQLRQQLLGAGGEACRNLVTTVHKRGYVLNSEVLPLSPDGALASPVRTGKSRGLIAAGLVLLLAALGLVWSLLKDGENAQRELTSSTQSVAVLPFLPLVESEREPVLEMGMADTLITRLGRIRQLVVRPMTAARRYGDMDRDPVNAGREMGVDTIVDGSMHRSGDTLRVSVRLLRVSDGTTLWAETINERFENVFDIQDELCNRIAGALALELGPQERQELSRRGTSDTAAYESYLRGRYHLSRLTPQDLLESVDHFRQAVERDPGYAQAWLGLANAQFRIPIAGEVPPLEYFPKARDSAMTALQIDPALAEAYAMLGWIAHWFEWDWANAESYFIRAIELNPNDTESQLGYANLLSSRGRYDEALAKVRRARELNPGYLVAAALEGGFLLQAGQAKEAVRRLEISKDVGGGFWLLRINLSKAYAELGRLEEALTEAQKARELSGGSSYAIAVEINLLTRLNRKPEAEKRLDELLSRLEQRYVPPYDLALAYFGLGDFESAITWLERAYEVRDPKLTFLHSATWKHLEDEAKFQDLLHRVETGG